MADVSRSPSAAGSTAAARASLRVGIIDYGLAGTVFHAPLVASTPGIAVTAIVTSDPERQERAHRD